MSDSGNGDSGGLGLGLGYGGTGPGLGLGASANATRNVSECDPLQIPHPGALVLVHFYQGQVHRVTSIMRHWAVYQELISSKIMIEISWKCSLQKHAKALLFLLALGPSLQVSLECERSSFF